jgi:hypothetical protein
LDYNMGRYWQPLVWHQALASVGWSRRHECGVCKF